eukprot:gene6431-13300_t
MAEQHVHGDKGVYCGGEWIPIEDCATKWNCQPENTDYSGCSDCTNPAVKSKPTKPAPEVYDVVVIGAGCVGSSIARELAKTTASVCVIDQADDVSHGGATKANSGIVHAGFDDKPGSNRAKFCWAGNQMYPQLDRELHFGFHRTGSLVVARCKEDMAILDELLERGRINGVENLRIIDQAELREREP